MSHISGVPWPHVARGHRTGQCWLTQVVSLQKVLLESGAKCVAPSMVGNHSSSPQREDFPEREAYRCCEIKIGLTLALPGHLQRKFKFIVARDLDYPFLFATHILLPSYRECLINPQASFHLAIFVLTVLPHLFLLKESDVYHLRVSSNSSTMLPNWPGRSQPLPTASCLFYIFILA